MTDPGEVDGPKPGAVAPRGFRVLAEADFSMADAVGGWRGLVESTAPGLVFVVVFVSTRLITPAVVASLAVALVAVIARLISRTPLTQALGGTIGVVIGVVWAWRTGEAQNYYVWGLVTNAGFALGVLVSILVRWPIVGIVAGALRQIGTSWRADPAHVRRYATASWLWFGLFTARLLVQVPLYVQAEVGWLGTARLVMGVPLWALTLWATWLLVRERAVPAARPDASPPQPT